MSHWHCESTCHPHFLSDPKNPRKVVEKYLYIAHSRYKQLVISMETLLCWTSPPSSVGEVTERLLASEDPSDLAPTMVDGKLYLTEGQWLQQYNHT